MGKFTFAASNPPLKTITLKVEEWDPEEEYVITEVDALKSPEFLRALRKVDPNGDESMSQLLIYAEILSQCLTSSSGEKAPKEWLEKRGISSLKRLMNAVFKLNGLSGEAQAELGKN